MWAMANCTFPPAIDLIGSVTIFGNCSLPIPRIARERGGRALKATIIMLNGDDGSKITEAPFYLTRHRRKKVVPQDMPQNTERSQQNIMNRRPMG